METRFTHAQRPLVILAAALLAVLGVFAAGGPRELTTPSQAIQSQSGDTRPLHRRAFQAPDATQGQDPTCTRNTRTEHTLSTTKISVPFTSYKTASIPRSTAWSELAFAGTRAVTNGAIALTWQATDLTAFKTLGDTVEKGVSGVASFFSGWLLLSMLVLGAGAAISRARSQTGQVINDVGVMVFAGIAVVLLSTHSGPLLKAVVGVHDVSAQASTKIVESTSTDLAMPFKGPERHTGKTS